ncbi:MAG: GNAT family N-acetyltransferase [Bacteroidia bacterium]
MTGDYTFSTDKRKLDIQVIHQFLSTSYWAQEIPFEIVKRSIENSFCFGVYFRDKQVGFARVVTDFATFGYLADVFVLEEHRGKGLSKKLMEFIMSQPELKGLRRFMLATRDAHKLYEQYGFKQLAKPERIMEIVVPDIYIKNK